MSAKGLPISKLIEAIRQASLQGVINALDAGCDIEEADQHGQRGLPLRTACFAGKIEIVRELIAHGANVNAAGSDGPGMPLRLALRAGHKDVVNLLLANGAEIPAGMALPAEFLALAEETTAASRVDIPLIPEEPAQTSTPRPVVEFPDMEFSLAPHESSTTDFLPGYNPQTESTPSPSKQADYQVDEVVDITGSYGIDTNLLTMDLNRANENANSQANGTTADKTSKKKRGF